MTFENFEKKVIEEVAKQLRLKQNALLFDNTPTDNSVNPVTSTGIKDYADAKLNEAKAYSNTKLNEAKNYTDTKFSQVPSSSGSDTKFFNTNVNVPTTSWVSDFTYIGYPYKAEITCTGITTSSVVLVIFNPSDAASGDFAPICTSLLNKVVIYAKHIPMLTTVIDTIKEV